MKTYIFINTLKNSNFVFNNFGTATDYSENHRYVEINYYSDKYVDWYTFDNIFDIKVDNFNRFYKNIRKQKLKKICSKSEIV